MNLLSSHSTIHKSDRLLRQQLGVWRKPSANIIVILVLANEATKISYVYPILDLF